MTRFDPATQAQIDATTPQNSTWLSANAGSGKTRVLTNRVALLLLEGAKPQNIVCLTYTNAAAVEMQNRLVERLGKWAMMPDKELRQELGHLGHLEQLSAERLADARTLFASAIETPGGLRIQTIHSFCSAVMRRFPLEAGVSPLFRELDERTGAAFRSELLRKLVQDDHVEGLAEVLSNYTGSEFDKFIVELGRHREKFEAGNDRQTIRSWFGLGHVNPNINLAQRTFDPADLEDLRTLRDALLQVNQLGAQKTAAALSTHDLNDATMPLLETVFGMFLTNKNELRKSLAPSPVTKKHPDLAQRLEDLAQKVLDAKRETFSEAACNATWALHRFATTFLHRYDAAKRERGFLDFDDLIRGTEQLLTNPVVASWVLFKLDGGIDHVLVDEAQDTNPAQWRVIKLLTQNITDQAADGSNRTIFVVGDKKQSIYSFQGAEPDAFDRMRDYYSDFLGQSGQKLHQLSLHHSFRSAPAILTVVDKVFENVGSADFAASDHIGFHADRPGRVDIWPNVPVAEKQDDPPWTDLSDPNTSEDADVLLAEKIADSISAMIENELITDKSGNTRRVHGGDILILVQRRSTLFNHIINACKRRKLPIAGSDRLKLSGEIAVNDLLALLSFLALPQDSLSLATVLRSPLFGWTEKELFQLSHNRKAPDLWVELVNRAAEFPQTFACLSDLRKQVDFKPPYELLEHVLTNWEGRQKLVARLGPEAEEGIDILLNKAREYDAGAPASLTGFLAWSEKDETDIKRQAESAGDKIRVMTVHGAKGLESQIVILPDTKERKEPQGQPMVQDQNGHLLWKQTSDHAPLVQKDGSNAESERVKAERLRLLYVAMTRAESWLIICTAGKGSDRDLAWHKQIDDALVELGAEEIETPAGLGRRFAGGKWPQPQSVAQKNISSEERTMPLCLTQNINPPSRQLPPLIPSKIGGEKVLSGAIGAYSADAADKGTAIHLLLERSDWINPTRFEQDAIHILRSSGIVLAEHDLADAIRQAQSVCTDPAFSHLFGPNVLKEVEISTPTNVAGHNRIYGIIDRLVVGADTVSVIDFKSNAVIPEKPEHIPSGLLDQMRAYYLAVSCLYPEKHVNCAILWTAAPILMPIPHNIVTAAMVTTSAS